MLRCLIICALTSALVGAAAVPASAAFSRGDARVFFDTYCVSCHNDRMKTGGLSLAAVDLGNISQHAPELEKVVRKLHSRAMPPQGSRRPDAAAYAALTGWLEDELDRTAQTAPNAGRTEAMHRLNRAEYKNAIRDLLGIEAIDIEQLLPADAKKFSDGARPIAPPDLLATFLHAFGIEPRTYLRDGEVVAELLR